MKYSIEDKLNAIRQYEHADSIYSLERILGIDHHLLTTWILRYEKYGLDGLRPSSGKYRYSASEKERIILKHAEKGFTLQELSLEYNVSRSTLQQWKRLMRHHLPLRSPGHPKVNHMSRPRKKQPQTELEILQAENLRLRAENALLKKVKALIEEEEARLRRLGQEP